MTTSTCENQAADTMEGVVVRDLQSCKHFQTKSKEKPDALNLSSWTLTSQLLHLHVHVHYVSIAQLKNLFILLLQPKGLSARSWLDPSTHWPHCRPAVNCLHGHCPVTASHVPLTLPDTSQSHRTQLRQNNCMTVHLADKIRTPRKKEKKNN